MKSFTILAHVPDAARSAVEDAARASEADVTFATAPSQLFAHLAESKWGLTLVSLSCDHVDEALLNRIAAEQAAGAVLVSATGASLEAALMAERVGAVGVLPEPFSAESVQSRIADVVNEGRDIALPPLSEPNGEALSLVGTSRAMAEVFSVIAKVADSAATVLITGESGTGKEVVARTLHDASGRRGEAFVPVNCAAIPEHLLESELFGHERGAFTGAVAKRRGRFERAHGGTLFLDEIGDMSLVLQAKLLRALEERVVERVGSDESRPVDVRVIAATNQVLPDLISSGRFREDLYYRLAVVEMELPPLRERGDDVRALALHFAARYSQSHGRPIRAISSSALARLESAPWPGNVRELRNVIDRAVLLSSGPVIRSGALRLGSASPSALAPPSKADQHGYPVTASLAEVEAAHIARVLESVAGHMGRAASALGIHRNTLTRKVQEYELNGSNGGDP